MNQTCFHNWDKKIGMKRVAPDKYRVRTCTKEDCNHKESFDPFECGWVVIKELVTEYEK